MVLKQIVQLKNYNIMNDNTKVVVALLAGLAAGEIHTTERLRTMGVGEITNRYADGNPRKIRRFLSPVVTG